MEIRQKREEWKERRAQTSRPSCSQMDNSGTLIFLSETCDAARVAVPPGGEEKVGPGRGERRKQCGSLEISPFLIQKAACCQEL